MSAPSSDLIPLLSVCYKENCTVFSFTDVTGLYSAGNTGGWNSLNKTGGDVTAATILITYPDATTQLVDVLSEVPNPIEGIFTYSDVASQYTQDGVYSFLYTIEVDGETFTKSIYKLFLCKVKCCIDKMWAKVPSKLCIECETEAFVSRVLFAQGLYNSLLALGNCGQTALINKVLTQLQTLCSFEDCNC